MTNSKLPSKEPSFPKFAELPTELRLQIWSFARLPAQGFHTITIHKELSTKDAFPKDSDAGNFTCNILKLDSNALLRTSHESRASVLDDFGPLPSRPWFNVIFTYRVIDEGPIKFPGGIPWDSVLEAFWKFGPSASEDRDRNRAYGKFIQYLAHDIRIQELRFNTMSGVGVISESLGLAGSNVGPVILSFEGPGSIFLINMSYSKNAGVDIPEPEKYPKSDEEKSEESAGSTST